MSRTIEKFIYRLEGTLKLKYNRMKERSYNGRPLKVDIDAIIEEAVANAIRETWKLQIAHLMLVVGTEQQGTLVCGGEEDCGCPKNYDLEDCSVDYCNHTVARRGATRCNYCATHDLR